jgi:predicted acyltransferase
MSRPHIERLQSLDFLRGLTMLLLLAEGARLFYFLNVAVPEDSLFHKVTIQFYHAEWYGMHFWDLIQPYFTFIVGVGMAFSLKKRWDGGASWLETFKHILFRCIILFFLGIVLQSGYKGKLVWELWNILTQLSISIFITFLIFRFPYVVQIFISFILLFTMEMLYRYVSIDGFDQMFIKDHNFGTFVDLALMGKTHPDGWVAINCIPTTAHMIWGALTGTVLININSSAQKIKILGLACMVGLIVGYGMDWFGISPINKKISTSSFVIASGGWCLASFLLFYWLVDVMGYKRWVTFFSVVGMNPIFIYIFNRTVGRDFLNEFIPIYTSGLMSWFNLSEGIINLTTYITILGFQWYLCYWLLFYIVII